MYSALFLLNLWSNQSENLVINLLTKLYEEYLISLSEQIKSQYIKGELSDEFTSEILDNRPNKKIESEFQIERPSLFIALILIVGLHFRRKLLVLLNSL